MHVKVCDGGSYYLIDDNGDTVASIENDYVPNGIIPGKYGDYVELDISEKGIITNWHKNPSIAEFFGEGVY